jgi:hypothetical protein
LTFLFLYDILLSYSFFNKEGQMPDPKETSPATNGEQKPSTPPTGEPEGHKNEKGEYVPADIYNRTKEDMLTYKERMRQAEAKVSEFEKSQSDAETRRLEEQKKYEELYKKEQSEKVAIQETLNRTLILSALRAEAMANGIVNPKDANIDSLFSKVTLKDGEPQGVADAIKNLKESNPYLFATPSTAPQSMNGKPTKPTGSLTYSDLLADSSLLSKVMREQPEVYKKMKDDYFKSKGR